MNSEPERKARRVREDDMEGKDQGKGDERQQKHRISLKKTKAGRRSRSQLCLAGSLSDIREHKSREEKRRELREIHCRLKSGSHTMDRRAQRKWTGFELKT